MRTRIFRSGEFQAVHIPAEIAYDELDCEVEIEREGDRFIISPVRRSPADILRKLQAIPDFMAKGRDNEEET